MTLVALPTPTPYPDARAWGASDRLAYAQILLDAAGEKVGWVLKMPFAGTIARIGIRIGAVTSAQSLDVRLEMVSATTGLPTGTLWAVNTSGALASPTADTWFWVTLTAEATVAIGDVIAVVVQFTSTTGNLEVTSSYFSGTLPKLGHEGGLPYLVAWTTGAWLKQAAAAAGAMNVAIELDNGQRPYVSTVPAAGTSLINTWGPAADYNEKGNKFILPFPCKVSGAMVRIHGAGAFFDIALYSSADVQLARLFTQDSDWQSPATTTQEPAVPFFFSSEVTLNAYEMYRLIVSPNVSSSPINVEEIELDSPETLQAMPGGLSFRKTERRDDSSTGAGPFGAWDIDPANAKRRMFVYPIISALDDGTSLTTTPRILLRREFQHEASGLTDP